MSFGGYCFSGFHTQLTINKPNYFLLFVIHLKQDHCIKVGHMTTILLGGSTHFLDGFSGRNNYRSEVQF